MPTVCMASWHGREEAYASAIAIASFRKGCPYVLDLERRCVGEDEQGPCDGPSAQ